MGGLLRLLLFAIALWLLISGVRHLLFSSLPLRNKQEGKEQGDLLLVQDPQCGRFVLERDAARASFRGQLLHFCSPECRDLYTYPQVSEGREKWE